MSYNKQAFTLTGVTVKEYEQWCKDNKRAAYKTESKVEFFARIADGRLARNEQGKLVKKHRPKK